MKKKSNVWIVFSVNNQNVHQISDNGCTSIYVVLAIKEMVASKHKVSIQEVKTAFIDSPEAQSQKEKTRSSVTSSQMRDDLKGLLKKLEVKN